MKIIHEPQAKSLPRREIASRAGLADGFLRRLLGLMFKKTFGDADALILDPCGSIHTFFVKFPLDVVCLDTCDEVAEISESLRPWKIFIPSSPTSAVVELPGGSIKKFGIRRGDRLVLLN